MKLARDLTLISAGFVLSLAAPLNVLVVEGPVRLSPPTVRIGHAGANAAEVPDAGVAFAPVAHFAPVTQDAPAPCHGGVRGKLNDIENYVREILGLASSGRVVSVTASYRHPISGESDNDRFNEFVHELTSGEMHGTPGYSVHDARPVPVMPGPFVEPSTLGLKPRPGRNIMWLHRASNNRASTFAQRLYKALQSLSPWEGRAMSFVLGCGLGVLLRMIWVFILLAIRAFRSQRVTQRPLSLSTEDAGDEAKEELLAPPEYNEKRLGTPDVHDQ